MPKGRYFLQCFTAMLLLFASKSVTTTTSKLLVLKDAATLPYVHAICNSTRYDLDAHILSLPAECHMPFQCKHIFSGGCLSGLSGTFSSSELELLINTWLPQCSVLYHEDDKPVIKAEDTRKRTKAHRRGLRQAPPGSDFEQNAAIDGDKLNASSIFQGQDINLLKIKHQTLPLPLWNLDRLDQQHLPLDKTYSFGSDQSPGIGNGVTIYILDTGIMTDHQEFQVWNNTSTAGKSRAFCGHDFVEGSSNCEDLDGHGSRVAGTAIGFQAGVAKGATVQSVKILDAHGLGTVGSTIAGLDFVAATHNKPAVVTLSLGVQRGQYSRAMEDSVRALVEDHGVMVIAAAGNAAGDSCQFSPGATPQAFTVAASDFDGKYTDFTSINSSNNVVKAAENEVDGVYDQTNQGACVDLFAPGVDIYSVCGGIRRCGHLSTSTMAYASGSSMAVPHVAGAAAIYLESHPAASPAEVGEALKKTAVYYFS